MVIKNSIIVPDTINCKASRTTGKERNNYGLKNSVSNGCVN